MKTEAIILSAGRSSKIHPAKMNPELADILVCDYSNFRDSILDPFAGSGTTGEAAVHHGRRYIGVDIESSLCKKFGSLLGDARSLPFEDCSFDAIITSPPYGEAIGRAGDRDPNKTAADKARYEKKRFGRVLTKHAVYGDAAGNLGMMPLERSRGTKSYISEMPKAVCEMARVLRPGGVAAIVLKDQRRGRRALGSFDLVGKMSEWGEKAGLVYCGKRVAVLPEKCWTLWMKVNAARWDIPVPNVEYVVLLRKCQT